jgi:hypothetical protein
MAQNKITINFTPCEPAPIGYRVKYRPLGSETAFLTWPVLFTTSPIEFITNSFPEATDFEGTIESVCPGELLSLPVPWIAYNSESASVPDESESASDSEAPPCDVEILWDFTEEFAQGSLQIRVNDVLIVSASSTSSGSITVQAGDEIKAQVNGQTGSTREILIDGCISIDNISTTSSVSHTWEAVCGCEYHVTGNCSN